MRGHDIVAGGWTWGNPAIRIARGASTTLCALVVVTACGSSASDPTSTHPVVTSTANDASRVVVPKMSFDRPTFASIDEAMSLKVGRVSSVHLVFGHVSERVSSYTETVDGISTRWAFYRLAVDDSLASGLPASVMLLAPDAGGSSASATPGFTALSPGVSGAFVIASPDADGKPNSIEPGLGTLYYTRAILQEDGQGRYSDLIENRIGPVTRADIAAVASRLQR